MAEKAPAPAPAEVKPSPRVITLSATTSTDKSPRVITLSGTTQTQSVSGVSVVTVPAATGATTTTGSTTRVIGSTITHAGDAHAHSVPAHTHTTASSRVSGVQVITIPAAHEHVTTTTTTHRPATVHETVHSARSSGVYHARATVDSHVDAHAHVGGHEHVVAAVPAHTHVTTTHVDTTPRVIRADVAHHGATVLSAHHHHTAAPVTTHAHHDVHTMSYQTPAVSACAPGLIGLTVCQAPGGAPLPSDLAGAIMHSQVHRTQPVALSDLAIARHGCTTIHSRVSGSIHMQPVVRLDQAKYAADRAKYLSDSVTISREFCSVSEATPAVVHHSPVVTTHTHTPLVHSHAPVVAHAGVTSHSGSVTVIRGGSHSASAHHLGGAIHVDAGHHHVGSPGLVVVDSHAHAHSPVTTIVH